MVIKTWLDKAATKLSKEHNIEKSRAYHEAHYIANTILGQIVTSDTQLSYIAQYCLDSALEKRTKHMPLSKIIQRKEFYSKMFVTNQHTLDPRAETEMIIDLVRIKARSVIDLGTGTGCLIITLLDKFDKATGIAIDISTDALKIAKENAAIYGLDKKIEFKQNNWANELEGHFDLVVANPPYVNLHETPTPELQYDPALGLFGDIKTYEQMLESMCNIKFYQMLIETPKNLINELTQIAKKHFPKHIITTHEISNTEVAIIEVFQPDTPQKIIL